ncbi:MAG: valine--tRNA ligase [Tabrizicola sp.]|uniref:valine--tRNA ligase n=1 Tax=Tabrizicola sp. TaxID=2005166 RepID=UPI002736BAB5|nr:valine--tRNA ligase [Tabrizicola sp.]MDP3264122.1 valine--tRNA ligase [Tabrizicola sp.]MDP3648751.1 valine--tRNA ligase [Paracoccaceae bacterium]
MPMEKTFNAAEAEARLYAMWESMGAFRAGANARPGQPAFSVMIPPPNVTGALHMGHAFNNTLQDILTRWHRMQGHDTLWQPGTDHAGIATQMVTEREMAKNGEPSRREMGREAFLARVWDQKRKSRGNIRGQLERLGASCDWSREAFTMSGAPGAPAGEDGNFHDAVIKVFVDLYHKGLIYRGKRLVNWDPHFETAISDLEVENLEVAGHMWHFKYRLAGGETYEYVEKDAEGTVTLRETRDYIAIATTRPETMLGDGAVAVHPTDERYKPIVGRMVHLPLCDRLIPIITDEYPDPTFGSGAVKITGAHDFNDYAVAKRGNIPCYRLMDSRARMRADGAPYAEAVLRAREIAAGSPTDETEVDSLNLVPEKYRGLDRLKARDLVVADITAQGLAVTTLVKETDPETGSEHLRLEPVVEAKKIMQPFGDRSKVVIEPMLTDQWFVDTAKIVEPALEAVRTGRTKIIPPSGEKTYYHWLENIEPWCISRQLWWGHQIPVWYGPRAEGQMRASIGPDGRPTGGKWGDFHLRWDSGSLVPFCAPTFEEAAVQARWYYAEQFGIDQDADLIFKVIEASEPPLSETGWSRISLIRDPDVLDTWFSSGLWPIGTLGWPEQTPELERYFPTSVLVTGQDILFFWVARMMMMQLAVVGDVPFHTVYLHGLVRDAKGKKMSKSLGNVIDPLEIIDEYGADALRFANAAMASLGGVLKLDTSRIAGYRNFGTKLWNACRFAEMNGVWDGHATGPAPTPKATVNQWIIGEAARTLAEVNAALADYRFDQAADALYKFVWGKVCDWYVEFAKPLFDGPEAAETRATMAWVLDQSMILLHPMMPFITEELWQTTGTRAKPLVHTDWPGYGLDLIDAKADAEMNWVTTLIDEIRSARAQMHVPVGLKLDMVATTLDDAARAAWGRNEALIKRLARIEALSEGPAPKGAISVAVEGAAFAIPLAGIIDITEEKARLTKAADKLAKEIGGLKVRLNNPNFARSAPEDVVEEARSNLEAREDEAAKLQAALTRLADLA